MKKLIAITDWASDSFTRQEFRTVLGGYLKDSANPNIHFVNSTPSSINAAFLASQIIDLEERYAKPLETIIFVSADPRIETNLDEKSTRSNFIVARMKSGIIMCGANAGYVFSFVKGKADEIFVYKNVDETNHYRDKDLYPRLVAHLMDEMEDELGLEELSSNTIPGLEGYYVGHIDNFGNIKTTIPHSRLVGKFEFGDLVTIELNNLKKKVLYVKNLFESEPGMLILYPGPLGTISDPYLEISIRRHFNEENPTTGIHEFNNPRPGMEIKFL